MLTLAQLWKTFEFCDHTVHIKKPAKSLRLNAGGFINEYTRQ